MASKSDLFARIALDYPDHPKIAGLSDAAFRAHIEMILYSRKYETDGVIKNRVANRLGSQSDTDVLYELLNNDDEAPSLVQLENGDFYIHGYEDMQETKAEIDARRARNARNGRGGGRPRKNPKTQSVSDSVSDSVSESVSESHTDSGGDSKPTLKAETETETETEDNNTSEVAGAPSDPAEADPNDREDIRHLLDYLDASIASYDPAAKLPNRTKANKDAARLLIDKDGRTIEQVQAAIDFAQGSEFWRPNIRSMSKLRDKYDTLRLQAQRPQQVQAGGGQYSSASERRLQAGAERIQRRAQRQGALDANLRTITEGKALE